MIPSRRIAAERRRPYHLWVLLGIICWFAVDYIALGKYSFVYTGDNITVIIPALLSAKWTNFGDWNPLSSSGWDALAIAPIGFGNAFLFGVLSGWLAYCTNILMQITAAVVAVSFLARRIGLGWPAASFSGFWFALGVTGQLHLASLHLTPAVILATSLVIARPSSLVRWLGLGAAVALLAGTAWISELFPFALLPLITWFVFVERIRTIWSWLIVVLVILFTMLPRLPELYTLAAYSALSHRALIKAVPTSASLFDRFIQFFTALDHMALLALAACAWIIGRRSSILRRLSIGFGVWIILVVLSGPAYILLSALLPALQGYNFDRVVHSPSLLLIFAGGFGFQTLLDCRVERANTFMPGLAVIGAVAMAFALSAEQKYDNAYAWITQGNWVANLESPQLIRLADRMRADGDDARAETLQIYPSYLHAYGIETAGGLHAMFSRRYYEFWGELVAPWIRTWPDDYTGFGRAPDEIYRTTVQGPRFRGPILMLMPPDHPSERRLADAARLNFLDLANVAWIVSRDRLVDPSLMLVEGPERGWNERSTMDKIRAAIAANFNGKTDFYIYRNREVFPRVFAVDRVETFDEGRAVLVAMAQATTEQLRRVAFVEAAHRPATEVRSAEITNVSSAADKLRIELRGDGPTFIFVSNSYSPFWSCTGDRGDVRVVPANHAFMGLIAESHTTSITCSYKRPTIYDWSAQRMGLRS